MKNTFNTFDYVKDLGKDLVRDFEKAGKTTHPHAVGEGRERSAINRLREILPEGVGIGSGFVIDSNGNVSSQCDIIIYEKNLALKFMYNDERYNYYNCESVIAVGEVKSDLSKNDLMDTINKVKKIKNMKRNIGKNVNVFRGYLSTGGIIGTDKEKFDPINNEKDQIYTFLICNSIKIAKETIVKTIINAGFEKSEYINLIISVDGKIFGYAKEMENGKYENKFSAINANMCTYIEDENCFGELIKQLFFIIENGRSVTYNPIIYVSKSNDYSGTLYKM